MDHAKPKYVSAAECCALLFSPDCRPCPDTWNTWRKKGIIPFIAVGGKYFYDLAAVGRALEAKFHVGMVNIPAIQ